ncbi:hypothetical protein [Nocardiopsis sp. CA-288880]|uniref:hypothetical protein n=1 Tax=Nocardiopsis sp. CA-288880 TaxID=3239995 RepID=UPI003D99F85D
MNIRGVSYHTDHLPAGLVERDMRTVREDLRCTAVMLIGDDVGQLESAAGAALAAGLDVWVRPRHDGRTPAELVAHLAAVADMAEGLRAARPGRVTLMVGTEFSLTVRGLLPGPGEFSRLQIIRRPRLLRLFSRRVNRRLHTLLATTAAVARERFHGPLTYGAAGWERVDWSVFDVAGTNLYRAGADDAAYAEILDARMHEAGRPFVVTEFGCGAYEGAGLRGAGSFFAVNWFADPPRLRRGTVRDEGVQARYLTELLDLYEDRGVEGAFVFTFAMPGFPHSEDPEHDLDMAGFGLVRAPADDPAAWTPKEAFHAVARHHRAQESGGR